MFIYRSIRGLSEQQNRGGVEVGGYNVICQKSVQDDDYDDQNMYPAENHPPPTPIFSLSAVVFKRVSLKKTGRLTHISKKFCHIH